MGKKDFEEMLNKHESVIKESDIDWENKKQDWLDYVQQFYDEVEKWLKPYVDQKKLEYNYTDISLTEKHIGTYTVKAMNINFTRQQIKVEPIGTLLIGTKGRIDMEGARGRVQFVLAGRDSNGIKLNVAISTEEEPNKETQEQKELDWTWKIVLREPRRIAYEEFNEDNFFNALMEIANGQ